MRARFRDLHTGASLASALLITFAMVGNDTLEIDLDCVYRD